MDRPEVDRDALGRENEELARRIRRLKSFGAFRRALREATTIDDVAAVSVKFATTELGCPFFAVYCAEREDVDFRCLASSAEIVDTIERASEVTQRLADASVVRAASPLPEHLTAVGLRSAPEKLVGIVVAAFDQLESDVIEELAFDIESALAARVMLQLRAEELAVLEIQERELVELLRDVQERDRIIREDLDEAREFQQKMLGASPAVRRAAVEVVYRPLGLVGGDLYAISVAGDRLRLFVADATGHGVRAALTTMFIKSGYEAVTAAASNPAALLATLNDAIARTHGSAEMLFSAICLDLDLVTGKLACASAAHPPLCIVNGAGGRLIEGGGAFLGLRPRMTFPMIEDQVAPGDGVYLLTDGFSEVCNDQGEQFGDERMLATIRDAHAAGAPAGEALASAALAFAAGGVLTDDATLLGARFGVQGMVDQELPPSRR